MLKDFIKLIETDQEGKPFGYGYVNRNHILYATFNAIECSMAIFVDDFTSNVGLQEVPLLNKDRRETGAKVQGVASITNSKMFKYDKREIIVELHNFLNGDNKTVETFEGFALHDEITREIKEAKERKQKEEEEKRWKDDLDAENRYRTQSGQPLLSMEELKALRTEESTPADTNFLKAVKDETDAATQGSQPEGGQAENTPGEQVFQPGPGQGYVGGIDPFSDDSTKKNIVKVYRPGETEGGGKEIIAEYKGRPEEGTK